MRSFASDNNSGVHPLVMEAIVKANADHAVGYGEEPWTAAAEAKIRKAFGVDCDVYIVLNGTGANCVALQAATRPFNSIIASAKAHICVDECGAPAKMTGSTIREVATADGKLTPEMILGQLSGIGVCHHSQPGVVYISQCTEMGTVYTPGEVRAIADVAHTHGLYLHMDGARIANACASLECTLREITVDAGVDILSFGGTKNGMMMGEAVVSFREELSRNLKYIRKQSAQLASKMRYLSSQFIPYLDRGLWLRNARAANAKARQLAGLLECYPQIRLTQKVESNALFFTMPQEAITRLSRDFFFYVWDDKAGEVRMVTSWDTTDKDINSIAGTLERIFHRPWE